MFGTAASTIFSIGWRCRSLARKVTCFYGSPCFTQSNINLLQDKQETIKLLTMASDVRQACELLLVFFLIAVHAKDVDMTADIFGALGDIAETLQVNNCDFKCPSGKKAYPNPKHTPKSNGCGSYGLQLDTSDYPDMTQCCDKHDICYDTCRSTRKKCDAQFKKCLVSMCQTLHDKGTLKKNEYEGCKTAATLLHGGATTLGCNAYKQSQKKACICRRPSDL